LARAAQQQVVVIGAGMGGLAAAIDLAAAGLAVTVVERADGPGGKMRTLPSAAGPVDAGPTVLTQRAVFDDLFAAAGARLDALAPLVAEPVLARHFWPGGARLDLSSDRDASAAAVAAFAGAADAAAFRAFAARAGRLRAAFQAPVIAASRPDRPGIARALLRAPGLLRAMAPLSSLARVTAASFRDPRLAQLFARYATYVGGAPDRTPALLMLIWATEEQGVWRVDGGMHRLALAMAGLARSRGAAFRFGAEAAAVEVALGRAAAVRLADGTSLPAAAVVCNADPRALALGLLGRPAAAAVDAAAVAPPSHSAHVWTFAARLAGLPLLHHNLFFPASPGSEFADLAAGRMPRAPTLYLCAQDRGAGRRAPAGPERVQIIANGPPLAGAPPDPRRAAEEAERCRMQVFTALAPFGLRVDPRPDTGSLTTPADFAALFPGSAGSLYGPSPHGLTASLKRPTARSRLPGLYLAGGGVHPGPGIPMATRSGRHAAAAILADLASTSPSRPTAMPGGISTPSATTARGRSRSSAS
jgi:1-hydroxycarotenoid 3,4-desaturase